MVSRTTIIGNAAVLLAILYQAYLKDFVFTVCGLTRTVEPIESFPYDCQRLRHPLLHACEDIVLDAEGRKVYAACGNTLSRSAWAPGGGFYNVSGRDLQDHVAVLNIDQPGKDGQFGVHQLAVSGTYKSSSGGKDLDFGAGLDIERQTDGTVRFRLINHRPVVDKDGKLLGGAAVGANSTVEIFDLAPMSKELKHLKTVVSDAILSPNNLVATGDGGFLFSNDHNTRTGNFRALAIITGGGNIGICSAQGECRIADSTKQFFTNGVARGRDGLFYVGHTAKGLVTVHSLSSDGTLNRIDTIKAGMAIDNLSVDAKGDIFAAGFPSLTGWVHHTNDPLNVDAPATILRIRKGDTGYIVEKVLEDRDAKFLPGSTAVVHDAKTGQFFISGVLSPYITVCRERTKP